METSDDEQGQKPLLFSTEEPQSKQSRIVNQLKAKKWIVVFAFAGVLAVAVNIVGYVRRSTKESSHSGCSSYTDSDECFFTGQIRLPQVLKPLTYEIRLHPDLKTSKFDGSVSIVVQALGNTNRVVFHQKGLGFSKSDVLISEVNSGQNMGVDNMQFDLDVEQAILKTNQVLKKGYEYAINIKKFTGNLNEKFEGFYKSSYMSNGKRR